MVRREMEPLKVAPRHTVHPKKGLAEDDTFPFKVGESLVVRIEDDRLIIGRE